MITLGQKARDKVSGFEGTLTEVANYLFGCDQYAITPPVKDGELKEGYWFDVGRLEPIGKKTFAEEPDVPGMSLGQEAKDAITGFNGIMIGRSRTISGYETYGLAPRVKDQEKGKTQWFDVKRLEIIGKGINPKEVRAEKPGGPNMDAPAPR